jgi:anti-anti-sigma regulatory factor
MRMTATDKKNLIDNVIVTVEVVEEQLVVSKGDINVDIDGSDGTAADDVVESIINLDATLTIQHVVKLHEKLKKAYLAHNAIEINASQVSSIDTATLQLLVALKKDAVKQQKEVVFSEPSLRFIESAGLLGLLETLGIDN